MSKVLVVMSHRLSESQLADLEDRLQVKKIIYPDQKLQEHISGVPPDLESLNEYLQPLLSWVKHNGGAGDLLVVQGEYGLTCRLVQEAWELGMEPIYATTRRKVTKKEFPDGRVEMVREFEHVRFRRYERIS